MGTQRQPQFRWHEGGEQAYHRAIRAWKTKVVIVGTLTIVDESYAYSVTRNMNIPQALGVLIPSYNRNFSDYTFHVTHDAPSRMTKVEAGWKDDHQQTQRIYLLFPDTLLYAINGVTEPIEVNISPPQLSNINHISNISPRAMVI